MLREAWIQNKAKEQARTNTNIINNDSMNLNEFTSFLLQLQRHLLEVRRRNDRSTMILSGSSATVFYLRYNIQKKSSRPSGIFIVHRHKDRID